MKDHYTPAPGGPVPTWTNFQVAALIVITFAVILGLVVAADRYLAAHCANPSLTERQSATYSCADRLKPGAELAP